jgi:hypothetical protein
MHSTLFDYTGNNPLLRYRAMQSRSGALLGRLGIDSAICDYRLGQQTAPQLEAPRKGEWSGDEGF